MGVVEKTGLAISIGDPIIQWDVSSNSASRWFLDYL
jgi:hypothetical protein